jgi:hypothetical protein
VFGGVVVWSLGWFLVGVCVVISESLMIHPYPTWIEPLKP